MQLRCTNGFFDEDILHLVLHLVMENLRVCSILLQVNNLWYSVYPQLTEVLVLTVTV